MKGEQPEELCPFYKWAVLPQGKKSLQATKYFDIITVSPGKKVSNMKEYEIVAKFCNACAGSSRPETFFEEAELESTDAFVNETQQGL